MAFSKSLGHECKAAELKYTTGKSSNCKITYDTTFLRVKLNEKSQFFTKLSAYDILAA